MTEWLNELRDLRQSGEAAVLVTVAGVRGSAPRDVGAKMLVTSDNSRGTIGGGELEYQCIRIAAECLRNSANGGFLRRFPLGSNCGQCCGGVVDVLFEPLADIKYADALLQAWTDRQDTVVVTVLDESGTPQKALVSADGSVSAGARPGEAAIEQALATLHSNGNAIRVDTPGRGERFLLLEPVIDSKFNIAVFGAGHVGSALVQVLAGINCSLRWIDSRRGLFPGTLPDNVQCVATSEPAREAAAMPADTYFLVMTHSHALDFDVVSAVLRRSDYAYCGLIGSMTKRRRFERKLLQQGIKEHDLRRLVCPIGISGVNGKTPQEIAIATAAELLRRRERQHVKQQDTPVQLRALINQQ